MPSKKSVDSYLIIVLLIFFFAPGAYAEEIWDFDGEPYIKSAIGRVIGLVFASFVYLIFRNKGGYLKVIGVILGLMVTSLVIYGLSLGLNG